ncbi:YveK family protein [Paenibacillus radicis (ex Xue et al. 2023)]|uniref:Wzz/FepE/Etk N-terminal domain-containing protein n=1 Tax=Paenibacillus radicis (ex Xue et al. 2023) TaxID=2972489 RepID=A0ABT1YQB5_9BACL|nr:Wzz/FepE/Etk N-terminal domain-containing protein [Paenibacillus radicis (ex Xue et al. 2023)]MCR8635374.1 Wzz/FepE/Etk N-terminal domain-containing protein [Paenibacillus radicis (ex Xue et al. 2023)]
MDIDLREYLKVIMKRLWLIILFVLITTITVAIYSTNSYQPIYQASTKLIVNQTLEMDQVGKEQIDFGAIGINIALIDTYKEIIKTPAIMDKVVQRYPELNMSAEQLISIVDVNAINGTQLMTIVARYSSYEKAAKVVNAVSEVFKTEIPKIMKVNNIAILNEAKMQNNPRPVNKQSNQYIMISFVVALVIGIGVALLLDAMDDTLKNKEDIRQIFELPTLAVVSKVKPKEFKSAKRKRTPKQVGDTPYVTTNN